MQKFINLKDYEINKIHFWPGFSSTSKDEKFLNTFYYALKNTLVVKDIKTGTHIAYNT
jgi:chromosome segregation ATPase